MTNDRVKHAVCSFSVTPVESEGTLLPSAHCEAWGPPAPSSCTERLTSNSDPRVDCKYYLSKVIRDYRRIWTWCSLRSVWASGLMRVSYKLILWSFTPSSAEPRPSSVHNFKRLNTCCSCDAFWMLRDSVWMDQGCRESRCVFTLFWNEWMPRKEMGLVFCSACVNAILQCVWL